MNQTSVRLTNLGPSLLQEHRPSTTPRQHPVLGDLLQFPLGMSCLSSVGLQVASPGISWPPSLPLPLWVPSQGLSGDAGKRLP